MQLLTAVNLMAVTFYPLHSSSTASDVHWQSWQIVNLVGAPLVAVMSSRFLIDDLTRWARLRRETASDYRRR